MDFMHLDSQIMANLAKNVSPLKVTELLPWLLTCLVGDIYR